MYHTIPPVLFTLLLLACWSPLHGQSACAEDDPFLVPPSRTFCVDTNGIAVVAFTLRNFGDPGNYLVNFPDGSDTTYLAVETAVQIERQLLFSCSSPPGNPQPPTRDAPFYDYRGQLTITRTDCVDEQGDPRRGSYDFNIVPNPIVDIRTNDLSCTSAPFIVDLTASLCSPELVDTYTWYVDGERVPGTQKDVLKNYVFTTAGLHLVRLEVTNSKGCDPYAFEKEILISGLPAIDLSIQLDSSSLCSPQVIVRPTARARYATDFQWVSNSADVSFSDPTILNPVITIINEEPSTRVITLIASNPSCPAVEESFEITTYSGQTINVPEPIRTCTDTPLPLCEQLTYAPPPQSISWSGSDPSISLQRATGKCPVVTFARAGNYVLTASGTDICGLKFSFDLPVYVRDGTPLDLDFSAVDTLCSADAPIRLLDYMAPASMVSRIIGAGVAEATFDPAGLSGEVALLITDSCGVDYPVVLFVLEQGSASLPDLTVCRGDLVNLAGRTPGTYTGAGILDNVFDSRGLAVGDYPVSYVGGNFCGSTGSFTVSVVDFPLAGFAITTDSCSVGDAGARYPVNVPITFESSSPNPVSCYVILETGDSVCDQDSVSFTFGLPGTYTVRQVVSAAGGDCTDTLERKLEVLGDFTPRFEVGIDSSDCDSLQLFFASADPAPGVSYRWQFSSGDSSASADPVLRMARPFSASPLRVTVRSTNGCFTHLDTLFVDLPRRFQVAFGFLNDNNTVCSGDTAYLIDNSVNVNRLTVTFPDGRQAPALPSTLVIDNPGQDVLKYVLRLDGTTEGCPDQSVTDTLYVLPVTTRAAYTLSYADNCSPSEVRLTNLSTPGSTNYVFWGDGSTPQPVGSGDTLVHVYRVAADTVFSIVLEAALCGIDTFSSTYSARAGANAAFSVDTDAARCTGNPVSFHPESKVAGYSLEWNFGDGTYSLLPDPLHAYASPGTYRVFLEATNPSGCVALDSADLVINSYNGPPLVVEVPAATCVDAPFRVGVSGFATGIAYDYGNQLLADSPIDRPYQEEGTYGLTVSATDENGCRTDTSTVVTVYPAFQVAIQPDVADTTIELGNILLLSFQMDPLRNLDSIRWLGDAVSNYNTQQTVVAPLEDGYYRLEVTDLYGCFATDSLRVRVSKDYAQRIYVPNIFSPNGDGTNETFGVDVKPNTVAAIRSLRILNRWGTLVYECSNCPPGNVGTGWDGRVGGRPAAEAVYLWTAEVEFLDGSHQHFSGDVTLLR